MRTLILPLGLVSLLATGAITGFFYAWICSTMWGLDAADPNVAIAAMQSMNASVRNAVFAPAFFATPVILLLTGFVSWRAGVKAAALAFAAAGLVYFGGGLMLTMLINVPMNEALALVTIPQDEKAAQTIWQTYSKPWQNWNQIRAGFSAMALLLTGIGLWQAGRNSAVSQTHAN